MPVLFLDIDDVICLNTVYGGYQAIDALKGLHDRPNRAATVFGKLFAQGPCEVLHRVHKAMGGRILYVISSTWREFMGREDLCLMFNVGGLGFVAASMHDADRWCTPVNAGRGERVDQIAAWLDRHHRGEPFAIIDDPVSGTSLWPALALPNHPFNGRVVLCSENVGLVDTDVQTLVDALTRPALLATQGEGS